METNSSLRKIKKLAPMTMECNLIAMALIIKEARVPLMIIHTATRIKTDRVMMTMKVPTTTKTAVRTQSLMEIMQMESIKTIYTTKITMHQRYSFCHFILLS